MVNQLDDIECLRNPSDILYTAMTFPSLNIVHALSRTCRILELSLGTDIAVCFFGPTLRDSSL